MKFLRFLKIFAICLGGMIGVCGVSMGIMYLTGYFNTTPVYPEYIAFAANEYEVEGDFKMKITTTTEDVNQLDIILSFDGVESDGDTISDGIITVPKYVKIGQEFDVKVVKSPQVLNGQTLDWVNGGISKLTAKSTDIKIQKAETYVYVDVPVYDINVKTSISSDFAEESLSSNFNVNSQFYAMAEFVPAKSMYQYSRDTQYGGEVKYKSIFFSSDNSVSEVQASDLDRYIKKYNANVVVDGAQIVARAFVNSSTQIEAFESVSGYQDENLANTNLLAILQNAVEIEKAVSKIETVNIKQLVVGNFSADASSIIPAKYFNATKIYANKNDIDSDEFSLNAQILASDNETLLFDQTLMLGLAVLKQSYGGYELAKIYNADAVDNSDADVVVNASLSKTAQIFVNDFENGEDLTTFFLPIENIVNVNHSYWEVTPLKENLSLHFALVLFDQDYNIREFCFKNNTTKEPKYIFDMQSAQIVSDRVYWVDPLTSDESLYIYDVNGSSPITDEYYLNSHNVFLGNNTFNQVKYFAYLEKSDGSYSNPNKGDAIDESEDLSLFVQVGDGRIYNASIASGVNVLLYEIPNGIIKPLSNENELDGKIKVLFATIKTDFEGKVLTDDGSIVVDRYSSNSSVGCQTMTFLLKKTLANVQAQVALSTDDEKAYFDETNQLFAVKIKTTDAFEIKFDLQESQKAIFERDYNNNKVKIDFYVNGTLNNDLFVVGALDTAEYCVKVSVGEFAYEPNDLGYRNIQIKITYTPGNGTPVTTTVVSLYDKNAADTKNSSVLQVYDGKISQIWFADFADETPILDGNTQQTPIQVLTNLEKVGAATNGIFVAKEGSSYSIKLDDNDITTVLMDETTKQIKVVAKDKYGSEIKETAGNLYWELVSSNDDVLKVNNTTKTISFVKASTDVVSLSVRTFKAFGEGNSVVQCERKLWFVVQTGGKIVKVEKIEDETSVAVFDNLGDRVNENGNDLDLFELSDASKKFEENSLELEILGKKGNSYNFANIVKIYYGLEDGNSGYYEVFDLKNVLKWTRTDANNLDDFVSFTENGFSVKNNFGKIGYINYTISSELGINLAVNIKINQFVDASVTNTYSHEEEGASSLADGTINYLGVYAQHEVDIKFDLTFDDDAASTDTHQVEKIVYFIEDESGRLLTNEVKIQGNSGKTFANGNDDNQFEIKYTFGDVTSNKKYKMTVVLDTSGSNINNEFEKREYDFSAVLYFYVNPNITTQLVGGVDTDNDGQSDTLYISAYQQVLVQDILKTASQTDFAIAVDRIVGTESLSFGKNVKPYVYTKLVDEKGNEKNYTYFELIDSTNSDKLPNTLRIKSGKTLSGSQTLYIGVYYGNGASNDLVLETYNFVVAPSLSANIELKDSDNNPLTDGDGIELSQKMGFVKYNDVWYLQLLVGETYNFEDIAKCFEVVDDSNIVILTAKINAEFASEYVNQTRYWNITLPTITINSNISELLVDRLFVNLTIENVGMVQYPVLITPQLAMYTTYVEDDNEYNVYANNDLFVNQTISQLVEYEIYDIIQDSKTTNIFASAEKTNGIVKTTASYSFEILDGQGNAFVNNFASIDADGNLQIDAIGEDKYIIVVAKVSGFDIYYRLKIESSLQLEAFYPYVQNLDDEETLLDDRAEYVLFRNSDTGRKTINLTEEFGQYVPANGEKMTIGSAKQNVTSRFMMFQYEGLKRIESRPIQNLVVTIKNVQSGNSLRDVDSSMWGQYAVIENQGNAINLVLFNAGNYLVTLDVCANNGATVEYFVKVELSSKVYTLVQNYPQGGGDTITDITKMPLLEDKTIQVNSPIKGEQQQVTLDYIKLKMTNGSTTSDKTNELGCLISDSTGKISYSDGNLLCDYTANDINAQAIFFTKYGEIGRRDIKINSITKVLEKVDEGAESVDNEAGYQIVTTKTLTSGQVVKLEDLFVIAVKQDDYEWTKVDAEYTNIQFDKNPEWLVGITEKQFVILPLRQGVTDSLTMTATTMIEGEEFSYVVNIVVISGFESQKQTSLDPVIGEQVIAGKTQTISIFEDLFDTENNINLIYNGVTKTATATLTNINGTDIKYIFAYEVQSGIDVLKVDNISITNNKISFATNAVASETTVKLKFVFELEYGEYRFESICYYQFIVTPDSEVVLTYPSVAGQQFDTEKLYWGDSFKLSDAPLFGQEDDKRVNVVSKNGESVETKVNYRVVQGSEAITITPSNAEGNSLDTTYTFAFNDQSAFALLEFDIVVNGLQRATYTLEVYKNFNSLYSVNVQTLYDKDGENEVFYIGEGRKDIFNGPQAFKFIVTNIPSLLSTTKTFEYFADTTSLGTFTLDASDLGQSKTVVLEYKTGLENLNLSNLKFKVNGGSEFYTLQQLASGENAYFTTNAQGNVNFEIFNRIKVQYCGIDVTEYADFLKDKIKISDDGLSATNTFNISYEGLGLQESGECNFEISKQLTIVYNNIDNVLGTYYYKVKSDVSVLNASDKIEIEANQKIENLMSVFGVVDHNNDLIVNYKDGQVVLPDNVKDKKLVFSLDFKKFTEFSGQPTFLYLDTMQPYEFKTLQPMTRSDKTTTTSEGERLTYDFEILANGAPNGGIYCELVLTWVYKLTSNESDNIKFVQNIKVEIQPDIQIELKNLDGSTNTSDNPQKITSEMYVSDGTKSYYELILVDKLDLANALINAYNLNGNTMQNIAYDLSYKTTVTADIAKINTYDKSKTITVYKPNFSLQNIQLEICDEFGYTKIYYIQVEPSKLISFVDLSGGQVYEKDTFALKIGSDETDVDHQIILSTTSFDNNCMVSYRLLDANGVDLNGVSNSNLVGIGTILRFNTLDSTVFSSTSTVYCYLEITLKLSGESYVINTKSFSLSQRYSSTVIDQSVRDGVEFDLKDKISFGDKKVGENIAQPVLYDEKTLVITNENIIAAGISAKLKSTSAAAKVRYINQETIESNKNGDKSYIMMKDLYEEDLTQNYNFYVSSLTVKHADNKLLKLTVQSPKLKSELTDSAGNSLEGTYSYDVLLYDGTQYVICTVSDTNPTATLPSTYNTNAMFGIVGYQNQTNETNGNTPSLNIEKGQSSGSYQTKLVIDANGYMGNFCTKEFVFQNFGDLGGFDKKQITVSAIEFDETTHVPRKVTVTINGTESDKDVQENSGKYYVVLTPDGKQTVSNENENWLLTRVSFNQYIQICDDKRLEVITVEKFDESGDKCTLDVVEVTSAISSNIDGGKLKFTISADADIKNIFVQATKDEQTICIYPENFEKIGERQYAFKLETFALASDYNFKFFNQKLTATTNGNWQVYNSSKNITQDITLANDSALLDVTQGKWDKVYCKDDAKTIDVKFTNNDNLTIKLDQNGKQSVSLLKSGKTKVDGYQLVQKNYKDECISATYYNDTLGFKVNAANSGVLKFEVKRTRGTEEKTISITVQLRSYKYTYFIGLTEQFGDMPMEGDVYTVTCVSKASSYASAVTILVPYQIKDDEGNDISDIEITELTINSPLCTFTVEGGRANAFVTSDKLTFDSKGWYEAASSQNCLQIKKYYLAEYSGAVYQVSPNYNLTPYFYQLNLDDVPDKNGNTIIISDYTQSKTDDGVKYAISLENWANGIKFEDINGQLITDAYGNDVEFSGATLNILDCTTVAAEGGGGDAEFDENFNIIISNVSDISLYHISIVVKVTIGGETKDENSEWLEIGRVSLQFNSKNQYQIPYNSQLVIANRNATSGDVVDTFRFVAYGGDASGEDLSFSAAKLFDDQEVLDMSQVRTIQKDDNKIYLLDGNEYYQLAYNLDEKTKVIVVAQATSIPAADREVFVYGLTKGSSITIKAKQDANAEDYVYATYTSNDEVFYGKVKLSTLTWKSQDEDPIANLDSGKNSISDYDVFTVEQPDCGCVPLSYINLDNIDGSGTSFKSIADFYDASSWGGGESGLIANAQFRYSQSFEVSKIESNTLEKIKIVMPSSSTKYFAISQNDIAGNVYMQINKLENNIATSVVQSINLDAQSLTGLGTLKGVILKDISNADKNNTSFVVNSVPYMYTDSGLYKVEFFEGTTSCGVEIYCANQNTSSNSEFNFSDFIYVNSKKAAINNENLKIKMTKTSTIDTTGKQSITNNNGVYSYGYEVGLSEESFKTADQFDLGIKVTLIQTDSTNLLWHEYMDKTSKTGHLYYYKGDISMATSAAEDIDCQSGETITDLWDGTISFGNLTENQGYILQLAGKTYYFTALSTNTKQNAFDIQVILEKFDFSIPTSGITNMPKPSDIEIKKFTSNTWSTFVDSDDNALATGNYYCVKYDGTNKALIYFDNAQNLTVNAVLGENYAQSEKIVFVKQTLTISEAGYYLIKNDTQSAVVKFTAGQQLQLHAINDVNDNQYDFISSGYELFENAKITITKLNTEFTIDIPDTITDGQTLCIKVGYNNQVCIVHEVSVSAQSATITLTEDFIKSIQPDLDVTTITFENYDNQSNQVVEGENAFVKSKEIFGTQSSLIDLIG